MITGLFFIFLTVSLFLGDGKQGFIEVFWAIVTVLLYAAFWFKKEKLKSPPKIINFIWLVFIGYLIIRTPASDSIGSSISFLARATEGYLIYLLFYSLSGAATLADFSYDLLGLAGAAVLSSLMILIIPGLALYLPPVNLLLLTYGHNHLADLIVFALPISTAFYQKRPNAKSLGLFVLLFAGLIGSFARGAWILMLGFFTLNLIWQKRRKSVVPRILIAAVFVLGLGLFFVSMSFLLSSKSTVGAPSWWEKHVARPFLVSDSRWEYWRQAVLGIAERPLFGSGPGTFDLVSRRFQSKPFTFSWYAHSFPLGTLAELGLVGGALLFILLFLHWRQFFRVLFSKHSEPSSPWFAPLFLGLSLTLIYSFFEFNLDLLVIWLLFWAVLGALTRERVGQREIKNLNLTPVVAGLLFLGIYYLLIMTSMIGEVVDNTGLSLSASFLKQPMLLKLKGASPQEGRLAYFFYRRDPEIVFEIAENEKSDNLYRLALEYDPMNFDFHKKYLQFLIAQKDQIGFGKEVYRISLVFEPKDLGGQIKAIGFDSPKLVPFYDSDIATSIKTTLPTEFLVKLYYVLGLKVLPQDPLLTKKLWVLARDSAPQWSYFHLELASLEHYVFHDDKEAQNILRSCQKYKDPSNHCKIINLNTLPPVGGLRKNIENIPESLP